jgi:hypothetical protein
MYLFEENHDWDSMAELKIGAEASRVEMSEAAFSGKFFFAGAGAIEARDDGEDCVAETVDAIGAGTGL